MSGMCQHGYDECPLTLLEQFGKQPGGACCDTTDEGWECVRIVDGGPIKPVHGRGTTPAEAIFDAVGGDGDDW